jgi:hypothetical protein
MIPAKSFAEFQGVVHMKVTSPSGSGTMVISVGKPGVRSDIDMQANNVPFKMSVIVKSDNPDIGYSVNDAQKTYHEIDFKKSRELAKQYVGKYVAKKIGNEKVNGYDCVHAVVTNTQHVGDDTDVWTNKTIADWSALLKVMTHGGQANDSMMTALKDVGADGFIVKLTHSDQKSGQKMVMELDKIEKKTPADSIFKVPADYKKAEAGAGMMSPEMQERLHEKMKGMTPEQRDQFLKGMQQQRQEQPPQAPNH